jgi:hypothetical protein
MIIAVIAKMHFIIGLTMFLFVALMVVTDDVTVRALLLLPIVITFMIGKVLHAIDQANEVEMMMFRYKKRVVEQLPSESALPC